MQSFTAQTSFYELEAAFQLHSRQVQRDHTVVDGASQTQASSATEPDTWVSQVSSKLSIKTYNCGLVPY